MMLMGWVWAMRMTGCVGVGCVLAVASCAHKEESDEHSGAGDASAVAAGAGGDATSGGAGAEPVEHSPAGAGGVNSGDVNPGDVAPGTPGPDGYGGAAGGGGDAGLPKRCSEGGDCDDGDACTQDICDAAAGCVSINPELDCRGWSGSKCAASAIVARGSGDQITCVPPTTLASGAHICADQACRGAPGCELRYSVEGGSITSTAKGYDFEGRVVGLAGTVSGVYGTTECAFEVGLSAPEPFVVHYGLSRPGCSQRIQVDATAQAEWSGVAVQASSPPCAALVSLLRSLLTPSQLNGYLQEPLETLSCAACAADCPGEIACR